MKNYSFHYSQRRKKIEKAVNRYKTFHLNHQNIFLMIISFVFTYFLVKTGLVTSVVEFMGNFGYFSAFVLGFLFSFGFTTTPAAVTLFFLARHVNPVGMALVAAIGASLSSLMTYLYVKNHLLREVKYILSEELRIEVSKFEIRLDHSMMRNGWIRIIVPALAGILTALPVPTEVITSILWNVIKYRPQIVMIYSFIFSFIGILLLGLFGTGL